MAGLPFNNLLGQRYLKNHSNNVIEVSFNQYGAVLGISGQLNCLTRLIFVERISLELTCQKQKSLKKFSWFAFRPPKLTAKGYSEIDFKMPNKFMLTKEKSVKYNILFIDSELYSKINPSIKMVRSEWEQFLDAASFVKGTVDPGQEFPAYAQQPVIKKTIQKLHDLFYWQEGFYTVKTIIETRNPKMTLSTKNLFELKSADIQELNKNIPNILSDLCRQPGFTYNSVFPYLT